MASQLDLKELERKAFRSTHQDGLWDIYMGGIVGSMSLMLVLPDNDESSLLKIVALILGLSLSWLVFWAGKKYITLPRLGQATFGAERNRRKRTLIVILGIIVVLQTALVLFSIILWNSPELQARLTFLEGEQQAETLLVAAIGALFVGPSLALIAYFTDFARGYYIAALMATAVFSMIFFDQPIIMLICAALIILPGVVVFVRFLRKYPLPPVEARHG
jgi:hypothetical protein